MNSVNALKKCLCIGAAFGATAATVATLPVGSYAWYSSQPRPWRENRIVAAFRQGGFTVNRSYEKEAVALEYVVSNRTAADYTIPADDRIFLLEKGVLIRSAMFKLED